MRPYNLLKSKLFNTIIVSLLILISGNLHAQTTDAKYNAFVAIFKKELGTYKIGKYTEHYTEGYILIDSKSEYFDTNEQVGLETIYQRCMGKDESSAKAEIHAYFDQLKQLNKEHKKMYEKIDSYEAIKSILKIRIYSDQLKTVYEQNDAIIRNTYPGMIEVIVLDLPKGVGSLEKKYLAKWEKSEEFIYNQAKSNTVNALHNKFTKLEAGKEDDVLYLLANDQDLFITSGLLDLKKCNIPNGKYGSLVSVPNNTTIMAKPLDDTQFIEKNSLSFMSATDYMADLENVKPVTDNIFWYDGTILKLIEKDFANKKLIFPVELQNQIK